MSEEDAAYHLIEHAGCLDRVTASPQWVDGLASLPAEGRVRMVRAVRRYAEAMNASSRLASLLAPDALSADALEEVEGLLLRRDAMETVCAAMTVIVKGIQVDGLACSVYSEVRHDLAVVRCVASEIDDHLAGRPDVTLTVAGVLESLPAPLLARLARSGRVPAVPGSAG